MPRKTIPPPFTPEPEPAPAELSPLELLSPLGKDEGRVVTKTRIQYDEATMAPPPSVAIVKEPFLSAYLEAGQVEPFDPENAAHVALLTPSDAPIGPEEPILPPIAETPETAPQSATETPSDVAPVPEPDSSTRDE